MHDNITTDVKSQSTSPVSTASLRVIKPKRFFSDLGVSNSTGYDRMNPKSKYFDPLFPKIFKLGTNSSLSGFIESECQAYIALLVANSRTANKADVAQGDVVSAIESNPKSASSRDVAIPSKEKLA